VGYERVRGVRIVFSVAVGGCLLKLHVQYLTLWTEGSQAQ